MTRYAYITRGAFANRRAEILADRGSYAHLAVESGVLNVPETDFLRLVTVPEVRACLGIIRRERGLMAEAGRPA